MANSTMKFVSEKIIDENATVPEELDFGIIGKDHPVILAYLFSDAFHFLTDKEKDYFLYLSMVLINSFKAVHSDIKPLAKEAIEKIEERNWELLSESNDTRFRERINVFFENFPQEDLLAFIEDSLIYDEEEEEVVVSKEGRDLMFVGLKTVLDGMMASV